MTSTFRAQHGYDHRPAANRRLPTSGTDDSLAVLQTAYAYGRRFNDATDVTWWVHLVRPGVERDITQYGSAHGVVLRFHSEDESRFLEPIPPDWFKCDDLTLCRYCEQAALQRYWPGGATALD